MAGLTSSDVTVTRSVRDLDIGHGRLSKNMTIVSVAFGDGAKTYPSGGVPLPAMGNFGYQRQVDFCAIQEPPANGFTYKYDADNHKIRIYTQGVVTGSTAATACANGALAEDSAAAETAVRLSGSAVDTTYDLGALIELPVTVAPAAATLKLLMLGE